MYRKVQRGFGLFPHVLIRTNYALKEKEILKYDKLLRHMFKIWRDALLPWIILTLAKTLFLLLNSTVNRCSGIGQHQVHCSFLFLVCMKANLMVCCPGLRFNAITERYRRPHLPLRNNLNIPPYILRSCFIVNVWGKGTVITTQTADKSDYD